MSSFENNIKNWVNIDNQIKALNEKARELREERNELCDEILSYASNNIMIPRNSIDQFKISEKLKFSEDNFTTGNLMYWKGHIGIILNRKKFLHSNGFHMKVEEENISNVIKRLGQASIIKIKS